jgi:hypothetical protein
MVSPNGNVLIRSTTDDGSHVLQVNGDSSMIGDVIVTGTSTIKSDYRMAIVRNGSGYQPYFVITNAALAQASPPADLTTLGYQSFRWASTTSDPILGGAEAGGIYAYGNSDGSGTLGLFARNGSGSVNTRLYLNGKTGNLTVGSSTDNGTDTFQVNGSAYVSGTLKSPTPALYDNSTNSATTAFVLANAMPMRAPLSGASTDLNTYTSSGIYHQSANANAGTGANYPVAYAGMLEVFASSSMVYQRYTLYNGGQIYTRSSYNGTWYGWRQSIDSLGGGTVPNLTITGTLTSTGGMIELGSTTVASTPFIDFHSTASANDYDARIIATGGTAGTAGKGVLTFLGVNIVSNSTFICQTGDIWAKNFGGVANSGVVYLGAGGNNYLYWNASALAYSMPNGRLDLTNTGNQLSLTYIGKAQWYPSVDSNGAFCVYNVNGTGCFIGNGGTAWAANSDERLKNIRSEITDAIEGVEAIRTVRYSWKVDDAYNEAHGLDDDAKIYVGVIAQDVQKVVPEALTESEKGYLAVQYSDLVPLCMAAIKELNGTLQKQATLIASLRTELDSLKLRNTEGE